MANPRRPDTYANAIRGFSPECVRYTINPSLPHILIHTEKGEIELPQNPHAYYFVNISEKRGYNFSVRITCPDGQILMGWMEWGAYFPFQIVDPKAELYDGRFNV